MRRRTSHRARSRISQERWDEICGLRIIHAATQLRRPEGKIIRGIGIFVKSGQLLLALRAGQARPIGFFRAEYLGRMPHNPASWGVVREELVADAFIQLIDRDLNGVEAQSGDGEVPSGGGISNSSSIRHSGLAVI